MSKHVKKVCLGVRCSSPILPVKRLERKFELSVPWDTTRREETLLGIAPEEGLRVMGTSFPSSLECSEPIVPLPAVPDQQIIGRAVSAEGSEASFGGQKWVGCYWFGWVLGPVG